MHSFVARLAEDYALGDWEVIENLSTGFVNENYKVGTGSGPRFLRIYRQQNRDSVNGEMDLYGALREIEFPTAYPIAKSDGNFVTEIADGFAVLFDFLEGNVPVVSFDSAHQIGMAIGKLCSLESRWQFKSNFINHELCETTLAKLPKPPATHGRLIENFEHYIRQLKEVSQTDLPCGIIHSDVFPDNTLFQHGRLVGIVDFEDYCHESMLFELAMAINGFGFVDNHLLESSLEGLCTGYSKQRIPTDEELNLLPQYIQLTALSMSAWHINNGIIESSNRRSIARAEELVERVMDLESQLDYLSQVFSKVFGRKSI